MILFNPNPHHIYFFRKSYKITNTIQWAIHTDKTATVTPYSACSLFIDFELFESDHLSSIIPS